MSARSYVPLTLAVIFTVYVASYLTLSRSGYATAEQDRSDGFFYFELENTDAWQRKNFFCVYLFWPLNWLDCWLGFGKAPASSPLMDLADGLLIAPGSSLALRAPSLKAAIDTFVVAVSNT